MVCRQVGHSHRMFCSLHLAVSICSNQFTENSMRMSVDLPAQDPGWELWRLILTHLGLSQSTKPIPGYPRIPWLAQGLFFQMSRDYAWTPKWIHYRLVVPRASGCQWIYTETAWGWAASEPNRILQVVCRHGHGLTCPGLCLTGTGPCLPMPRASSSLPKKLPYGCSVVIQ